MKFAFLDECGTEADDVSVIAGVVIDAYRVHSVKREWARVLASLEKFCSGTLREFHMRDVYGGQKEWKGSDPLNRDFAVEGVLEMLSHGAISIVFSSTTKASWNERVTNKCPMATSIGSRWMCEALHIALSINKAYRGMRANKGNSLLIFDRGTKYERHLSDLLVEPPSWSDSYYDRKQKEKPLGEIFDTSFFVDSSHAPLIQLADTVAYILRRYSAIEDLGNAERYKGELAKLELWIDIMKPRMQPSAHRYKKVGRCDAGEFFWSLAPPSLRSIA